MTSEQFETIRSLICGLYSSNNAQQVRAVVEYGAHLSGTGTILDKLRDGELIAATAPVEEIICKLRELSR
jgi:hypothetical protein